MVALLRTGRRPWAEYAELTEERRSAGGRSARGAHGPGRAGRPGNPAPGTHTGCRPAPRRGPCRPRPLGGAGNAARNPAGSRHTPQTSARSTTDPRWCSWPAPLPRATRERSRSSAPARRLGQVPSKPGRSPSTSSSAATRSSPGMAAGIDTAAHTAGARPWRPHHRRDRDRPGARSYPPQNRAPPARDRGRVRGRLPVLADVAPQPAKLPDAQRRDVRDRAGDGCRGGVARPAAHVCRRASRWHRDRPVFLLARAARAPGRGHADCATRPGTARDPRAGRDHRRAGATDRARIARRLSASAAMPSSGSSARCTRTSCSHRAAAPTCAASASTSRPGIARCYSCDARRRRSRRVGSDLVQRRAASSFITRWRATSVCRATSPAGSARSSPRSCGDSWPSTSAASPMPPRPSASTS